MEIEWIVTVILSVVCVVTSYDQVFTINSDLPLE